MGGWTTAHAISNMLTNRIDKAGDQVGQPHLNTTSGGTIIQDSAMGTGTNNCVTVTSSATADTFGSYAVIDASASADVWISHVTIGRTTAAAVNMACEIATGAGGAEVPKIRFSSKIAGAGVDTLVFALPIPIKVVSGTRIAAHIADSVASADSYQVGISYYTGI